MSDLNPYEEGLAVDLAKAQARIKELEQAERQTYRDALKLADRIEELEAKLAQQDNLVQAAVAAALREAAKEAKSWLLQETDGLGIFVAGRTAVTILALIPKGAQAALDRVVAKAEARGMERAAEIAKGYGAWHHTKANGDLETAAHGSAGFQIAAAIRKGGE